MRDSLPAKPPKVLILHAYSPTNSGDGLLVTLALEAIRRAIGVFDYHVVASDADAFGDPLFLQWRSPLPLYVKHTRRLTMLATMLFGPSREIRRLADEADLVVAVGGAYLRGGNWLELLKSRGAHDGQVRLAAAHGNRAIYLPQSIGPYSAKAGARLASRLSKIDRVYARDDRTMSDFSCLPNIERVPDMAILEWARDAAIPSGEVSGRPIFVARDLINPRSYYELLEDVRSSGRFDWAVQATGSANNDIPLTERFGGQGCPNLAHVLTEGKPRVVVSTRLHGSLSSLIAGYPTIHLSYERKGKSAFMDLGIPDFCISARDASLAQIDKLVQRIESSPEEYWARIESNRGVLSASAQRIELRIRQIVSHRRGDD